MKKLLVSVTGVALAAAVAFFAVGATTVDPITPEEAWSRLVGEWANPDYAARGIACPVEQVYRDDLTGAWYCIAGGAEPDACYRFTVRKAWRDAEGNVYCQVHFRCERAGANNGECAGLLKVNATGSVLEVNAIAGIPRQGPRADWGYGQLEQIDPDLASKHPAPSWGWLTGQGWFSVYLIYHRA